MKARKYLIALTMACAMGLGAAAYANTQSAAADTTSTVANTTSVHQKAHLRQVTGVRGYDYVMSVLKNKLGMTEEEITNGLNAGKTMYDLTKEKGMTEEQFKAALLEEKNKAIDNAVAAGTITKEEGDSMKAAIENNMDSCTGVPGQNCGNGKRGNNQRNNGCNSSERGNGSGKGNGNMSCNTGVCTRN